MDNELLKIYADHEEEMRHNTQTRDMSFKIPHPFHRLFRKISTHVDLNMKEFMYLLIESYLRQKLSPMDIHLTRRHPRRKS